MKLYDIFEENPDCDKFIIWKRHKFMDSYVIDVTLVSEDGVDWRKAPSKKINWFKVIFNKKYRNAIKDCFDYAMWYADTFRGENSAEICVSELTTKIRPRRNNNFEYSSEVTRE